MSQTSIFCIASSRDHAELIVGDLEAAGFRNRDISVLFPDKGDTADFAEEMNTHAPVAAVTGAGTGGVLGGALGFAAGIGALAIPGAGPFLAAGPIIAAWSGAAIGATVGGMAGGLIGLGMPEKNARHYASLLQHGSSLISVHAYNAEEKHRAEFVVTKAGGREVCSSGEASRLPATELAESVDERSTAAYAEAESSSFSTPHHDARLNDTHA